MLPFSSFDFYLVIAICVGFLWVSKKLLFTFLPYSTALLITNLVFLLFFYSKPWHIIFYLGYAYAIIWLFLNVLKTSNKLVGILCLIFPMLLVKLDIRFHFYPFTLNSWISFAGLSYLCFRIVSAFMDLKPDNESLSPKLYVNYLVFFPTLLIGPIDRLGRFEQDLNKDYKGINLNGLVEGWESLVLGVFYKYICAEFIQRYWLAKVNIELFDLAEMASSMYGYYLYLFFDFAGYSLLAIGVGKMMGIDVPVNFVKPFLAKNPQDFWKRFHKSLGDWLSDYFFKPLYMFLSRKKSLKKYPLTRQNLALFATFFLMGLWNGFAKSFIISGVLFGIYSVVYNSYIFYCKKKKKDIVFGNLNPVIVKYLSIFIMFNLAAFSIYIFSGRCPFI